MIAKAKIERRLRANFLEWERLARFLAAGYGSETQRAKARTEQRELLTMDMALWDAADRLGYVDVEPFR